MNQPFQIRIPCALRKWMLPQVPLDEFRSGSSGSSGERGSPRQVTRTWGGQRMAGKPFKHDAVRLLHGFFENGMATALEHDEFRAAQFAFQLSGGSQTPSKVLITPHQKRWNPLYAATGLFHLSPLRE